MAPIDLPDTQGLGYEPLVGAWICDAHGVADCDQTAECRALPWGNTGDQRLRPFVAWAHEQFDHIIKPYDEAVASVDRFIGDARDMPPVPEMPDEACDAYWPSDWIAAVALAKRQGVPVPFGPGSDQAISPYEESR